MEIMEYNVSLCHASLQSTLNYTLRAKDNMQHQHGSLSLNTRDAKKVQTKVQVCFLIDKRQSLKCTCTVQGGAK